MNIRYNTGPIPSRYVSKLAEKHIPRLGKLIKVEGKRVNVSVKTADGNREPQTREIVVVTGEKGTATFHGVSWGYTGEGPRKLAELLQTCGIYYNPSVHIAFNVVRHEVVGQDWEYNFLRQQFTTRSIDFDSSWHTDSSWHKAA